MLFHISEEPGIVEFTPRPSKYTTDPVVWAVNEQKIRNYPPTAADRPLARSD